MPTLDEFGAWVKVGGRRALEFDTKVEDERTTICFIVSETNKVRYNMFRS